MSSEKTVLFIKPYFEDISIMPSLGIGYLASVLRQRNHNVYIIDNSLEKFSYDIMRKYIEDLSPDIVGITSSTPMIYEALAMARLSKEVSSDIITLIGGCHPSVEYEEILRENHFVDYVYIGEGEESICDFVENVEPSKKISLSDVACIKNGVIVMGDSTPYANNLDNLPFPAFDLFDIEGYFQKGTKYGFSQRTLRSLPIMATRGCPSKCVFCQRFLGNRFRYRSPDNLVSEIECLVKKYGVHDFNIIDDNYTFFKKNVMQTVEKIQSKGLQIRIRFPNGVREDFLDEELLEALKSIGVYDLDFGFESGSQKVLDIMKKGKKLTEMGDKVELCKKLGFKTSATFLFGTPGETIEDMEETVRYSLSIPLDKAAFGIVIPFPGTEVRRIAIDNKYLVHSEYDEYNPILERCRPAIQTNDWDVDQLIAMVLKARKKFYVRPKFIIQNFSKVLSSGNVRMYSAMIHSIFRRNNRRM
jgi:anaerobic magnesium-protoporphyrin IX monomethyl ester cyclase